MAGERCEISNQFLKELEKFRKLIDGSGFQK